MKNGFSSRNFAEAQRTLYTQKKKNEKTLLSSLLSADVFVPCNISLNSHPFAICRVATVLRARHFFPSLNLFHTSFVLLPSALSASFFFCARISPR